MPHVPGHEEEERRGFFQQPASERTAVPFLTSNRVRTPPTAIRDTPELADIARRLDEFQLNQQNQAAPGAGLVAGRGSNAAMRSALQRTGQVTNRFLQNPAGNFLAKGVVGGAAGLAGPKFLIPAGVLHSETAGDPFSDMVTPDPEIIEKERQFQAFQNLPLKDKARLAGHFVPPIAAALTDPVLDPARERVTNAIGATVEGARAGRDAVVGGATDAIQAVADARERASNRVTDAIDATVQGGRAAGDFIASIPDRVERGIERGVDVAGNAIRSGAAAVGERLANLIPTAGASTLRPGDQPLSTDEEEPVGLLPGQRPAPRVPEGRRLPRDDIDFAENATEVDFERERALDAQRAALVSTGNRDAVARFDAQRPPATLAADVPVADLPTTPPTDRPREEDDRGIGTRFARDVVLPAVLGTPEERLRAEQEGRANPRGTIADFLATGGLSPFEEIPETPEGQAFAVREPGGGVDAALETLFPGRERPPPGSDQGPGAFQNTFFPDAPGRTPEAPEAPAEPAAPGRPTPPRFETVSPQEAAQLRQRDFGPAVFVDQGTTPDGRPVTQFSQNPRFGTVTEEDLAAQGIPRIGTVGESTTTPENAAEVSRQRVARDRRILNQIRQDRLENLAEERAIRSRQTEAIQAHIDRVREREAQNTQLQIEQGRLTLDQQKEARAAVKAVNEGNQKQLAEDLKNGKALQDMRKNTRAELEAVAEGLWNSGRLNKAMYPDGADGVLGDMIASIMMGAPFIEASGLNRDYGQWETNDIGIFSANFLAQREGDRPDATFSAGQDTRLLVDPDAALRQSQVAR